MGMSAVWFWSQAGPLHGTATALALTAALMIGLSGYLLARAAGLLTQRLLVVQLATVITAGVVVALLLGSIFRFTGWPITGYLVALHTLLLLLALLPARRPIPRVQLPPPGLSLTLIVCTLALVGLAATTVRFAYAGELTDRGYFASVSHWLLTSSGSEGQLARIIGMGAETRLRVEGLTVFAAALEYGSGVTPFDYQWHLQSPLLIAMLPVVMFALVYRITRRQQTAALAVVLLTLLTAQTFDYTAYEQMAGFTGRHPLLDLRTLREVGLAILLPMSLFAFITALRRRAVNWVLLTTACLFTLITIHFTAALAFMLVALAVGGAQVHRQQLRLNWRRGLIGVGIGVLGLVVIVGLPLLTLRARIPELLGPVAEHAMCTEPVANELVQFVELPGIGLTYTLAPQAILSYHPAPLVALLLSLVLLGCWRRFSVRYLLAPLLLAGVVSFSPAFFQALTRLTGLDFFIGHPCYVNDLFIDNVVSNLSGALVFTSSVPIALAISLSELLRRRRALRRASIWLLPLTVTLVLFVSATEPIPIPFSLRDQVQAMDDALAHLNTQSAELNLANALSQELAPDRTWRILAPDETGAAIIQRVPNTLLSAAIAGPFAETTTRFFSAAALGLRRSSTQAISNCSSWRRSTLSCCGCGIPGCPNFGWTPNALSFCWRKMDSVSSKLSRPWNARSKTRGSAP
ncbi:MAG: hypothetical protein IPO91_16140 [Chloroflexi bacterium]|nr:hypothetical protein [Chloroflexota bacterium]